MTNSPKFSHRPNSDGTVDSICHQCFATVANEAKESDLCSKEREHSCNPATVEWFRSPARKLRFA